MGKEPLLHFTNKDLSQAELDARVIDFVAKDGNWDWHSLLGFLTTRGCMKLASNIPPAVNRGMNTVAWNQSKDNDCSVSATYSYLANDRNQVSNYLWKKNWD